MADRVRLDGLAGGLNSMVDEVEDLVGEGERGGSMGIRVLGEIVADDLVLLLLDGRAEGRDHRPGRVLEDLLEDRAGGNKTQSEGG